MKNKTKSDYALLKPLPVLFSFFVMGFVDVVGISVSYAVLDNECYVAINEKSLK